MNIMVTGSEGFLGVHLVGALMRLGHHVVRYDVQLGQDILNRAQLKNAYSTHQEPLNIRHEFQGLVAFTRGLGARAKGMEGNWT